MGRAWSGLAAVLLVGSVVIAGAPANAAGTPTPRASASASPSYDPGPRPISLVNLCAANLKLKPPLFQQPSAPLAIAANEVDSVTNSLNSAGTPMYVSILSGPGERANGMSREIQERMGTPGTFLTIIGTVYDAFSTEFDAQPILTQAFAEQRSNGTAAVVERFAELSGQAARGEIETPDYIAWRPTAILFAVVLVVGGLLLLSGRRKSNRDSEPTPPAGAVDVPESS